MRTLSRIFLAATLFATAGCFDSNSTPDGGDGGEVDGGVDGGRRCMTEISCVDSCGTDFLQPGECVGGVPRCPAGTFPETDCPPDRCTGGVPPIRPGEVCECIGRTYTCEGGGECPGDVDPRNPDAPGSACRFEGATCGGGSACGAGIFCECDGASWNCAVAEPDPACYCEREPEVGSPCVEEGMGCGECCPTSGGTGWSALVCSAGVWEASDCPAVECTAPEVCAADALSMLGDRCGIEGQACGDPCCGDSMMCDRGRWVRGPEADCLLCDRSFTCGDGFCTEGQVCYDYPGPDDGPIYDCRTQADECADCECLSIREFETCEMVDGRAYVRAPGLGG